MDKNVAGIVLAAGFSRRLGRPKQLVELLGETLLERAVRIAQAAGLRPVVAVVNESLAPIEIPGCDVVVNTEAAEGMAASIRCGAGAIAGEEVAGAVVMTCDQVAVTAEHLRELCAEPAVVAGSRYAGRVGVPAYFPVGSFAALGELAGDQGARELLKGARVVECEALALDVDTEAELARAEEWMRER